MVINVKCLHCDDRHDVEVTNLTQLVVLMPCLFNKSQITRVELEWTPSITKTTSLLGEET